jgi:hypothetical protein
MTRKGARLLAAVEEIYAELETEGTAIVGVRAVERLRTDLTRAIRASHAGQLPAVRPSASTNASCARR